MTWNQEEKKSYNQEYYKINKEAIIAKGCLKVKCSLCGRDISSNGYNRHMKTKLCTNTQQKNKYILERTTINEI